MTFRNHLKTLADSDDLVRIERRLAWQDDLEHVAVEPARTNGPAVVFADQPGLVRLVSGAYGGPDRVQPRDHKPWSRLALALGCEPACSYTEVLADLTFKGPLEGNAGRDEGDYEELAATSTDADLYTIGLPRIAASGGAPAVTDGILAVSTGGTPTWAPIRGMITGETSVRLTIPEAVQETLSPDDEATIALGVPPAAVVASRLQWATERTAVDTAALAETISGSSPDLASIGRTRLPGSSELVIHGRIKTLTESVPEIPASWERMVPTAGIELSATDVASREDPVVPFTPLGTPMADDQHLTGAIEAARLMERVNRYWPVEPIEWVDLPPETGLGICVVASRILYAGFEWQLANLVFNFSQMFDKILILDADTTPENLGTVFDDLWIKAHPSHDWEFSEPIAPAASVPAYRSDEQTGSRLYINATWDTTWEEEAIAPRVTFESSYPESIQETVLERWNDYGFDSSPDERL